MKSTRRRKYEERSKLFISGISIGSSLLEKYQPCRFWVTSKEKNTITVALATEGDFLPVFYVFIIEKN